jgi:hypothetical protein
MNTLQVEEHTATEKSIHGRYDCALYVFLGGLLIYTTVALILVLNTRKQLAENQASQEALTHKLVLRQLETEATVPRT